MIKLQKHQIHSYEQRSTINMYTKRSLCSVQPPAEWRNCWIYGELCTNTWYWRSRSFIANHSRYQNNQTIT